MSELTIHDPFQLPDPYELEREVNRPRWWYAQQLRMAGASWEEVAASLGYASANSAQTTVKASRRDRSQDTETLEDIVDLELQRLDMLQLICWRTAQQGDIKAVQTILAIMQLRMRMLGTEKKPDGGEHKTQNTAIFIGGDQKDFIEGLKRVREAAKVQVIQAGDGNGTDQQHAQGGGVPHPEDRQD